MSIRLAQHNMGSFQLYGAHAHSMPRSQEAPATDTQASGSLVLSLLHRLHVMGCLLLDHVSQHLGVMGCLLGDCRHQAPELQCNSVASSEVAKVQQLPAELGQAYAINIGINKPHYCLHQACEYSGTFLSAWSMNAFA